MLLVLIVENALKCLKITSVFFHRCPHLPISVQSLLKVDRYRGAGRLDLDEDEDVDVDDNVDKVSCKADKHTYLLCPGKTDRVQ